MGAERVRSAEAESIRVSWNTDTTIRPIRKDRGIMLLLLSVLRIARF